MATPEIPKEEFKRTVMKLPSSNSVILSNTDLYSAMNLSVSSAHTKKNYSASPVKPNRLNHIKEVKKY